MKQLRKKKSTGFTILEILIALGTISVAILGTIAAIAFGLRASKLGSDNTVAIQVNRKIVELIVQGIYPSATETSFHHAPGDPNVARGTAPWRRIFLAAAAAPRWFLIEDYGYVPGSAEAARFASDTERFELDVSAQLVVRDRKSVV